MILSCFLGSEMNINNNSNLPFSKAYEKLDQIALERYFYPIDKKSPGIKKEMI